MRVVFVEDTYDQAELYQQLLEEAFAAAKEPLAIMAIETESEFVDRWTDIINFQPHVFVVDLLLRWVDPMDDPPPTPPGWKEDAGIYHAGLRCLKRIRDDARTAMTPVIIYTVISHQDVQPLLDERSLAAVALQKEASVTPLLDQMRLVTR